MTNSNTFELPRIGEADIARISVRMGLPERAFLGEDGTDERAGVFKDMGNIDVAACPGSGKTTLLVAKLAAIMEKWPFPTHGICVLSHTNVARNEIGERLGNTSAGSRLLSYPHFIGTIHGFVNEFLAIPWLLANGFDVKTIDTEIALKKRWHLLPWKARQALENMRLSAGSLRARAVDFSVGDVRWQKGTLGTHTPTYQSMVNACKRSVGDGIFCYEEMFVWANDFLDKRPDITSVIRRRFPFVMIDEAQDTTGEQGSILHRIFSAGDSPVVVQRYGDGNQAIFHHGGDEDPCGPEIIFPQEAIKRDLPTSHRFGQAIANLADPLGLVPYRMIGKGPAKIAGVSTEAQRNTVFFFDDEEGARRVPKSFANLLFEIFSEDQLRAGTFKAVGQVHKKPEEDNFPRSVGSYWDLYDPHLSRLEPVPATFVEYLMAGCRSGAIRGEAFPAYERIAEGFLKLLNLAGFEQPTARSSPRSKYRRVLAILETAVIDAADFHLFCHKFAIERADLTEESWENEWKEKLSRLVAELAGTDLRENALANAFLTWSSTDLDAMAIDPSRFTTGNTQVFTQEGSTATVSIQFGSIHSVKGETHTGTLVLETFHRAHNMNSIGPWLFGKNAGAVANCSLENRKRLKLHYVAMTRPSHVVCLALHRPTFFRKSNDGGKKIIDEMGRRGWHFSQV